MKCANIKKIVLISVLSVLSAYSFANDLRCDATNLLPRANLGGCDLSDIDFNELRRVRNGRKIDLTRATLTLAKFEGNRTIKDNVIFDGAKLDRTNFQYTDLTGVNFKNSMLNGTKFNGANLTNADLSDATLTNNVEFMHTNLTNLKAQRIKINDAVFLLVNAYKANFQAAQITRVRFVGAIGRQYDKEGGFRYANFSGVRAKFWSIYYMNFEHANLEGATMPIANGVNFKSAILASLQDPDPDSKIGCTTYLGNATWINGKKCNGGRQFLGRCCNEKIDKENTCYPSWFYNKKCRM